jgi:toxin ParE1/3/4
MELFQLSKEAKLDLRSIATFTENRWGKAQRNMYIKQLDDAFTLLGENYEAGTACDNIRKGYRKFPQGSHLIFYKLGTTASIFIVRILHKSMDIDSRI